MIGQSIDFLFWDMPWWGLLLVMLGTTQLTIISITLYLHRSQAHLALDLHPALQQIFRFWVWFTTAQVTSEWVAIHRKHHARCETEQDPHSPVVLGLNKVLFEGSELYQAATKDETIVEQYGHGVPKDWLELNLYKRYRILGVLVALALFVLLFGPIGITMWAVQMLWSPVHAAGVINGLGHAWGYRNWECPDASTNVIPWGFWIGGEELHNNHHAFPSSAKLSAKPWEFDIGWMWIQLLSSMGLAKVKRTIPKPIVEAGKEQLDMDAVRAILRTKMHVMSAYANTVIKPVIQEERAAAGKAMRRRFNSLKRALVRDESRLNSKAASRIENAVNNNPRIKAVYEYGQHLKAVWATKHPNNESLLQAMQEWVQQAETSGVKALQDFADSLKGWQLSSV